MALWVSGLVFVNWSLGPETDFFFFKGKQPPLCRIILSVKLHGRMIRRKHLRRSEPLILSFNKVPFLLRGSDLRGESDNRLKEGEI